MTYSQNSTILATDFNTLRSTLNDFWSTGTGNAGYGQSAITTVEVAEKIRATNYWRSLTDNITTVANHTGSLISSMIPQPSTTGKIIFLQNVATNLITVNNNRLNAVAQGSTSTTTATSDTVWNDKMIITFTISFDSATSTRYFFNAGGQLGLSFSHPNSGGIDTLISDICSEAGTIFISSPTSGSVNLAGTNYNGVTKVGGVTSARSTVSTNAGYFALTTTDTQLFNQTGDAGTYTSYFGSFLRISASVSSSFGVTGGSITFTCEFDEVPNGLAVSAGTVATLTVRPPSTTYLTNTWGTPTIVSSIVYTSSGF